MTATTRQARHGALLAGQSYDLDDATGAHLVAQKLATPGGTPTPAPPPEAPAPPAPDPVVMTRADAAGLLPDQQPRPRPPPRTAHPGSTRKPGVGLVINAPSQPKDGKG